MLDISIGLMKLNQRSIVTLTQQVKFSVLVTAQSMTNLIIMDIPLENMLTKLIEKKSV